jgi:hypothetical protein
LKSVQVTPLPPKPGRQAQLKLPTVLVHVAFAEQLSVLSRHSLLSTHEMPSPEKPDKHWQWNVPGVLMHVPKTEQLLPPPWPRHSLKSLHTTPLPP